MPTIFLSYRRDDTKAITWEISKRLKRRYGDKQVIMDVDAIPTRKPLAAMQWVQALQEFHGGLRRATFGFGLRAIASRRDRAVLRVGRYQAADRVL
jgi:hypothetical protein